MAKRWSSHLVLVAFPLSLGPVGCGGEDGTDSDGDGDSDADADIDADGDSDSSCDQDGDGYRTADCGGDDCDDSDPNVHPGASDGWTDERVDGGDVGGTAIAIGPSGEIHIAFIRHSGVTWATDASGGWRIESVDDGALHDSVSLAVDAAGTVHVAYNCYDGSDLDSYRLVHATRGGVSWEFEHVDTVGVTGFLPSLALGPQGAAHIAYLNLGLNASEAALVHAWKTPESWAIETILADGNSPSLAVDSGGSVHVVYVDGNGVGYGTNASGLWELDVLGPGSQPSIALDVGGAPHVAYSDDEVLLRHARREADHWEIETIDEAGGFAPAIDFDAEGALHVAYWGLAWGLLRYATNASGEWRVDFVTDGADNGTLRPSLALDSAGSPHIVFVGFGGELRHAWRTQPDGVDQDCDDVAE